MKLAVIITMYDEFEIVLNSIKNIKQNFEDAIIVVVQSECELSDDNLEEIKMLSDEFIILPDLSKTVHRFELPSQAICRNISEGFNTLYDLCADIEIIAVLTGDSLITDSSSLVRRYYDMMKNGWIAMVSQALGQDFHAPNSNPIEGRSGGRYQDANTTDFACCFFIVDGQQCQPKRWFSDIKITNKWTSEQCLGDELVKCIGGNAMDFRKKVGILNNEQPYVAYSYNDGLKYHAKTGLPSR